MKKEVRRQELKSKEEGKNQNTEKREQVGKGEKKSGKGRVKRRRYCMKNKKRGD